MKKRIWKILALTLSISLIAGSLLFVTALFGNPVSGMLAKRSAKHYLAEHFPDTDYHIERVGYNFKDGNYYAHIRSDSSIDTQFTIHLDSLGRVERDTYDSVLSGWNTYLRAEEAYRQLTKQVLDAPAFPYPTDIGYGSLAVYPREAWTDPNYSDIPDYALVQEDFILDHSYDPKALGAQAGELIVYVDSDTLSFPQAAEVLLTIREEFDRAGVPFRSIRFTLWYPRPEDGPRPDDCIEIDRFPYEEIYPEGLEERIEAADQALKAWYAQQDAMGIK